MFTSGGSRVGHSTQYGARASTAPYQTKVRLAANQSITNATWTTVSWDTLLRDDVGGWNNATPKIITNPGQFTRVRFAVNTGWANNSTNTRFHAICQNGSDNIANAIRLDLRNAFAESNACWATDYIPTVKADIFYLMVNQTSGGSLNFSGSGFPGTGSILEASWYY